MEIRLLDIIKVLSLTIKYRTKTVYSKYLPKYYEVKKRLKLICLPTYQCHSRGDSGMEMVESLSARHRNQVCCF